MDPEPRPFVMGAAEALARAAQERVRAARAGAVKARHEVQAKKGSASVRELHVRMALLHQAVQQRHTDAAAAWTRIAAKLEAHDAGEGGAQGPSSFMAAVAESVDAQGAAVTFSNGVPGAALGTALRAGSSGTVRAAQELEIVVGEGPSLDAIATGRPVAEAGARLSELWPVYGPAARELGVESVVALPIERAHEVLGCLTLFGVRTPDGPLQLEALTAVAASLAVVLLSEGAGPAAEIAEPWRQLYDDQLAVVNQAAGMVAVQEGCGVRDALDLIGARAFAAGVPAAEIAGAIVDGALRLS